MDPIRAKFAQHGLRCTQQRIALYEVLAASKSHPTADELFQMVRDRVEHLSLATVYNTLEAFSAKGLCRKLPTTSGAIRYDADTSDHLHIRFRDSDRLMDVPPGLGRKLLRRLPDDVLGEIEDTMGVKINGVQVQLIGESAPQTD